MSSPDATPLSRQRATATLPADHPVSRDVPTLIHDSRAWVPAEDYDRMRERLAEAEAVVYELCDAWNGDTPQLQVRVLELRTLLLTVLDSADMSDGLRERIEKALGDD